MGIEIERKFLLHNKTWRDQVHSVSHIQQGYFVAASALTQGLAKASVRVRIENGAAELNIKAVRLGIERAEYGYRIPMSDATSMLQELCSGLLEKRRHRVRVAGFCFEVDEFLGENSGLVVAEIELSDAEAAFPRPDWLGLEVSDRPRYYNVQLIDHPYCRWSEAERAGARGC